MKIELDETLAAEAEKVSTNGTAKSRCPSLSLAFLFFRSLENEKSLSLAWDPNLESRE